MSNLYLPIVRRLVEVGWSVQELSQPRPLPEGILARYPGMPSEYRELVESAGLVSSSDEKAWLNTTCTFSSGVSAYAWNEWEQQSLEAAGKDEELTRTIRRFWDRHLPILMSVKSGYAHFSLDLETMRVVQGGEPEYEDISPLAPSIDEMFQMVLRRDPRLERWV